MIDLLAEGKRVFDKEIDAAKATCDALGLSFVVICNAIDSCRGRVILTGMGKSGHICRKIVATMQSLGIKAQFMHPGDALHGDLGMLTKDDMVLALSNSGETDEILQLVPAIQKIGTPLYCVVGRMESTLAKFSEEVILLPKIEEAYLGTLVPTSSTTATLMIGDALAVAVASKRGFAPEDFGVFHPNGLLGKRLTLKVESLMLTGDENSAVLCGSTVEDTVFEMCRKSIGGVNIIDEFGNLKGVFTDGDLRRLCHHVPEGMGRIIIDDIMTTTPIALQKNQLVADVIEEIRLYNRTVSFYPVVDNGVLVGSLRLLDISRSGLF